MTGRDVTNYTISECLLASNEDRTRDLALTKRMLCQLSYRGESSAPWPVGFPKKKRIPTHKTKNIKRCHHPESHRGYRRHKPGYCSYTIAAESGGSGYRSRFSTLRRLYATMYNNPPLCVHRDSNPNLILGRDKYYPCTMDAKQMPPLSFGVSYG